MKSKLHQYNGILKEIISQRNLYPTEQDFTKAIILWSNRINYIQGYMVRMNTYFN